MSILKKNTRNTASMSTTDMVNDLFHKVLSTFDSYKENPQAACQLSSKTSERGCMVFRSKLKDVTSNDSMFPFYWYTYEEMKSMTKYKDLLLAVDTYNPHEEVVCVAIIDIYPKMKIAYRCIRFKPEKFSSTDQPTELNLADTIFVGKFSVAHTFPQSKMCKGCQNPSKQLALCKNCRAIYYCSVKCQRQDWPKHKKDCSSLQHIRNNAIGASRVCNLDECRVQSDTAQTCGRCRSVYYCNITCQRKDWKAHKSGCHQAQNQSMQ